MRKRKKKRLPLPDLPEIEREIQRLQAKSSWYRALKSIIYTLIVVAAVAVLICIVSGVALLIGRNKK